MIINKYKYNSMCEETINEWSNGLYSHLLLHLPSLGGVKEDVFTLTLAKIFNKETCSKRNLDESYLYLKYSKDINEYKRKLFFDSPSIVAKNYNQFNGVFVIEVSDWIHQIYTNEFKELLEYIKKNANIMKFIFIVRESDKEKSSLLVNTLSEVINVKEITMTYPDSEYFMVYLESVLYSKNINIENMRNKFIELIDYHCQDENFKGYESIDKLADNISYLLKKNKDKNIDFSQLYQMNKKKNDKEKTYIGF